MLFVTLATPIYPKILQIKRSRNLPVQSLVSCLTHTIGMPMGYTTMVTLFVEEYNPITPSFYNNLIAGLQLHRLTCTCGHSGCLSVHGYYTRSLKTPEGKLPFRICWVICSCCFHTHALLPSSIVPYSQISLAEHVKIISCHEDRKELQTPMNHNPSIDESNCRYIIRNFLHQWKQRLLSDVRYEICCCKVRTSPNVQLRPREILLQQTDGTACSQNWFRAPF